MLTKPTRQTGVLNASVGHITSTEYRNLTRTVRKITNTFFRIQKLS